MDINLFVFDNLLAKLIDQLFLGRLTVAAGRDQEGDVGIRVAAADFREHQRGNHLRRDGAGVVGSNDHDLLLPSRHLAEARGADRMLESLLHKLLLGLAGVIVMHIGYEGSGIAALRNIKLQEILPIRKFNNWHNQVPPNRFRALQRPVSSFIVYCASFSPEVDGREHTVLAAINLPAISKAVP